MGVLPHACASVEAIFVFLICFLWNDQNKKQGERGIVFQNKEWMEWKYNSASEVKKQRGKCLLFLYFVNRKKKNWTICKHISAPKQLFINKTNWKKRKYHPIIKKKACNFSDCCYLNQHFLLFWHRNILNFLGAEVISHLKSGGLVIVMRGWKLFPRSNSSQNPQLVAPHKQTLSNERFFVLTRKYCCNLCVQLGNVITNETQHTPIEVLHRSPLVIFENVFNCLWLLLVVPFLFFSVPSNLAFKKIATHTNCYHLHVEQVFLSWTFIWLMLLQVCLNSTCFLPPFVAVASWNRWRRREKAWTCQEGRSVVPRNQKIGIGERRHSLRTDVSSFSWFLFVCFFDQQTGGKRKKQRKQGDQFCFFFGSGLDCAFFWGFCVEKTNKSKKKLLDDSQQWLKKGCSLPCITHHFRKFFVSCRRWMCKKGSKNDISSLRKEGGEFMSWDWPLFKRFFFVTVLKPQTSKDVIVGLKGKHWLGWVLKFRNSSKVLKPIRANPISKQLRAPHTPNTQHSQAHAQHFQQKHQVETKQLTDFCFAFSQVKRFARIGQLIRTLKWSLLCLFLLITNSTDPTTTATNKKCVFWWCDVWPSGTALVEFHTKHKAENAIRLSWMGLFKFARVKIWVRWKQACFFSFQNRVVGQRARLDQCHCSGVVVVNWAHSAVFWKSHKNWKKSQKKVLSFVVQNCSFHFYWSAEQKPKLNKTKKNCLDNQKRTKQKGKKKKLKHQSFVLWRGQKPWSGYSWVVGVLQSFWQLFASSCCGEEGCVSAWVFWDVSTPILFQKRSLWLVSVFAKSFVWLWTFLSCDKFFLCFFSVWSGFSGWSSTPLCLSCFMSGFHELFSCCWFQVAVKLVHRVYWAQFSVASFLVWNSFVVSLVVTTTPIALHPELIETPFFWWFTWSPSTTNCNHTRYSHLFTKKQCWIVDSVVLFLLSFFCFCFFFFFGCLGGLIEVTQCCSSNPHWCVCFVNNKQ